jgi:carbon storage regulator
MLQLTRRVGEEIVIGGIIKITICEINRGQVRVGIDAPRDIPIHRMEVQRKIDSGIDTYQEKYSGINKSMLNRISDDDEGLGNV